MGRKTQQLQKKKDGGLERRRRRLALPVLALLLLAVASNAYLIYLYVQVHSSASPTAVSSFCDISAQMSCVSVAASRYSAFGGIPVAVYGVEFFGLALGLVLLSLLGVWRLRAWDSLVFVLMAVALPVSLLMAWLSWFRINSLCILCTAVYGVNLLLLLLLGLAHRDRIGQLLREGPRELRKALGSNRGQLTLTALVVIAGSQFVWVPQLMPRRAVASDTTENPWAGIPAQGHVAGNPRAKITIEEFTDFQCPSCAAVQSVMREVMSKHAAEVRLVHRHYPLDQACNRKITRPFHDVACQEAFYAHCAAKQDKFWHFSVYLYEHQHGATAADLEAFAGKIGIDVERLRRCVKRSETRAAVLVDIEEGIRREIRGTPTFFINGKEVTDPTLGTPSYWDKRIAALRAGES